MERDSAIGIQPLLGLVPDRVRVQLIGTQASGSIPVIALLTAKFTRAVTENRAPPRRAAVITARP